MGKIRLNCMQLVNQSLISLIASINNRIFCYCRSGVQGRPNGLKLYSTIVAKWQDLAERTDISYHATSPCLGVQGRPNGLQLYSTIVAKWQDLAARTDISYHATSPYLGLLFVSVIQRGNKPPRWSQSH